MNKDELIKHCGEELSTILFDAEPDTDNMVVYVTCPKPKRIDKIKSWMKSLFSKKNKQKVIIHFDDGDWVLEAENGLIQVPWIYETVPMFCESDGTVTLRLMWGNTPCAGYGKQYGNTTWEPVKTDKGDK